MPQIGTIRFAVAIIPLRDVQSPRCSCKRGSVKLHTATKGALGANTGRPPTFIIFPIEGGFGLRTWHHITSLDMLESSWQTRGSLIERISLLHSSG